MPFWNLSCYQKVLPHIPPHPPTSGVGLRTSVEVIRTVLGGNSNLRHADIGTSQWIFTKCFWIVDSVLCAFYILIHWILLAVPWCKGWYCYLHVLKKEGGSLPAGVCSLSAFGWFWLFYFGSHSVALRPLFLVYYFYFVLGTCHQLPFYDRSGSPSPHHSGYLQPSEKFCFSERNLEPAGTRAGHS